MFTRVIVAEAVKKHTNIDISAEAVSFSSGAAIIKGIPQAGRSVIFIKKESILLDINNAQNERVVTDIR